MRNRTWSDVVMAAMIALCVAIVAEPRRQAPVMPVTGVDSSASSTSVADSARSLASALLLGDERHDAGSERAQARSAVSATDRAVANAAAAAGNAARGIEMPFFSFGGDASAE
jgi:hypothetical protein